MSKRCRKMSKTPRKMSKTRQKMLKNVENMSKNVEKCLKTCRKISKTCRKMSKMCRKMSKTCRKMLTRRKMSKCQKVSKTFIFEHWHLGPPTSHLLNPFSLVLIAEMMHFYIVIFYLTMCIWILLLKV